MKESNRPRIILDTDLGGDIDDLGAVAVLHELADRGECEILGIVSDTPQRHAIGCIDAVGLYFGRRVPVGRPAWPLVMQDTYADTVARATPGVLDGEDAPEAVALLVELLRGAPDASVVVATIGQLWHQLALVQQHADLVRRKVRRYVVMGGYTPLPPTSEGGRPTRAETNFAANGRPGVTADFLDACPVPVVFCGFEAGNRDYGYATGDDINGLPDGHPVKVGYLDFFARPPKWCAKVRADRVQPWSIWDQITVLHAVRGPATDDAPLTGSGFREVTGSANHADPSGHNTWHPAAPGGPDHAYLAPLAPPADIAAKLVEPLMVARRSPA